MKCLSFLYYWTPVFKIKVLSSPRIYQNSKPCEWFSTKIAGLQPCWGLIRHSTERGRGLPRGPQPHGKSETEPWTPRGACSWCLTPWALGLEAEKASRGVHPLLFCCCWSCNYTSFKQSTNRAYNWRSSFIPSKEGMGFCKKGTASIHGHSTAAQHG